MKWFIGGEYRPTIQIPWLNPKHEVMIRTRLYNDTDITLNNVVLYTDEYDYGKIFAKLENDTSYNALGAIGIANFYVGTIKAGESKIIDLMVTAITNETRLYHIPVYAVHGVDSVVLDNKFYSFYAEWSDCYEHLPLWYSDYAIQAYSCPAIITLNFGYSENYPVYFDTYSTLWSDTLG